MPKIKTNRGAAKRFRKTASGKVRFKRAKKNHILTKKTQKLKRSLKARGVLKKADVLSIERMLGEK